MSVFLKLIEHPRKCQKLFTAPSDSSTIKNSDFELEQQRTMRFRRGRMRMLRLRLNLQEWID